MGLWREEAVELVVMVVAPNSSSLDVGRVAQWATYDDAKLKETCKKCTLWCCQHESRQQRVCPRVDVDYICTMLLHQIIHEKL